MMEQTSWEVEEEYTIFLIVFQWKTQVANINIIQLPMAAFMCVMAATSMEMETFIRAMFVWKDVFCTINQNLISYRVLELLTKSRYNNRNFKET